MDSPVHRGAGASELGHAAAIVASACVQGIAELQRARKGDRRDPLLLTNVLWSFAHVSRC